MTTILTYLIIPIAFIAGLGLAIRWQSRRPRPEATDPKERAHDAVIAAQFARKRPSRKGDVR
jgi:hypothetical protein